MPVGGTEDALHVLTSALRHQARVERHDNREVFAVDLLVAQTELNGLGQRVDHVTTVVVQNQNVAPGVQNRRDVLREVTGAQRGSNGCLSLPAEGFGVLLDRTFLAQPQV